MDQRMTRRKIDNMSNLAKKLIPVDCSKCGEKFESPIAKIENGHIYPNYRCKKCRRESKLELNRIKPWRKFYNSARERCNYPRVPSYKYYGAKGIKFLLTMEQLKELWHRDNAVSLEKPSLDRINPEGNYVFENCRFIEWLENIRRQVRKIRINDELVELIKDSTKRSKARHMRDKPHLCASCRRPRVSKLYCQVHLDFMSRAYQKRKKREKANE